MNNQTMNLLVVNCKQLLTIAGASKKPKTGKEMDDLGIIEGGAVVISNGIIDDVGKTDYIRKKYAANGITEIDATGKIVMPGFVDSHTHAVFGGSRVKEFVQRLHEKTYLEIMKEGGGVLSTVEATRNSSLAELVNKTRNHLDNMLIHGTTTVEIKSGYGLDFENELKILRVISTLKKEHPIEIVPTFLGAHVAPKEFQHNPAKYAEQVIGMLSRFRGYAKYCDVFCDKRAFSVTQSRKILLHASTIGYKIKIHAAEFKGTSGVELAAELHATSADHLDYVTDAGIKALIKGNVIGVLLPGVPFFLMTDKYAPATKMIDEGLAVAIATDFNPGSCPTENMTLILTLACLKMKMTPEQAINAATINGAHALEMADSIGSIEKRKKADIVILDVDDYNCLPYHFGVNHVDTVIKNGKVVVRDKVLVKEVETPESKVNNP
ncbi:MAG TPA: imidazolonepropionase [Candidatus Brocadiaceae bacterium]